MSWLRLCRTVRSPCRPMWMMVHRSPFFTQSVAERRRRRSLRAGDDHVADTRPVSVPQTHFFPAGAPSRRPRGGRPGCAGRARPQAWMSRLTSATTAVTPPGVPPAPHFRAELQLTPRIWAQPAEAPAHAAENAVETKKRDATTRARKMRRGNEMCCAAEAAKQAV